MVALFSSGYPDTFTGTITFENVVVDGTFTSRDIDDNATSTQMTIDDNGVGFGAVTSPNASVHAQGDGTNPSVLISGTSRDLAWSDGENLQLGKWNQATTTWTLQLTIDDSGNMDLTNGYFSYASGARDIAGSGTPEGSVSAPVGSTYRRTDGGASTSFYVKESGTGNTGWVAK